jgi:hypothetical protein
MSNSTVEVVERETYSGDSTARGAILITCIANVIPTGRSG